MENYKLIYNALECASKIMRSEKSKLVKDSELEKITYGQFKILDAIILEDNPTITSLSKALGVSKPAMTIHLQNMEQSKLVYKEKSSADRRYSYIRLTDLAKSVVEGEFNASRAMTALIHSKLTSQEEKAFYKSLAKICNNT